ncbi:MAG: aminotransferase class I/II-fold pyridoxal phosphate-dependent enzyme [Clostridiales bacterium]|nr:aminotransferase class I/II-fold pyridoxal phosphate-dependent enzyme [Clostridiales bacterium]
MKFNTILLHGTEEIPFSGSMESESTLPPVCQTSAFRHTSAKRMEQIFHNKAPGFSYTRLGNPTVEAFEKRMTVLEGGIASVACASGMAAVFNALMNILRAGDEIVSSASLYGGSIDLFRELESFEIRTHYVENHDAEAFLKKTNDRTRCYFAETIGNPKLDVTDIRSLADLAHSQGLPLFIDNTAATAYLVKPIELGADIVVNSTSKYINGSSNSISGVITDGGKFRWDAKKYPGLREFSKFGPFAYIVKLRNGFFRNTGGCLSPQNAFYNIIGMETLGLRMERISGNALVLARWLQKEFPDIVVNYPGLETNPCYAIAKKQFDGHFGGILTIRVGTRERAYRILDQLKIPLQVSNIGDTKTLVLHPESTLAVHSTEEEKEAAGVYDDLIRVSVGIEDVEDLMEDFGRAIRETFM